MSLVCLAALGFYPEPTSYLYTSNSMILHLPPAFRYLLHQIHTRKENLYLRPPSLSLPDPESEYPQFLHPEAAGKSHLGGATLAKFSTPSW